jgi:hypothetical protein
MLFVSVISFLQSDSVAALRIVPVSHVTYWLSLHTLLAAMGSLPWAARATQLQVVARLTPPLQMQPHMKS